MNWLLGAPRSVYASEPVSGHVHAVIKYDDASGVAEGSMRLRHCWTTHHWPVAEKKNEWW